MTVRYEMICGDMETIFEGKYGEYHVTRDRGMWVLFYMPYDYKGKPLVTTSLHFVADGSMRFTDKWERMEHIEQAIKRWERMVE